MQHRSRTALIVAFLAAGCATTAPAPPKKTPPDPYQVAFNKHWAGQKEEAFELMLALAERGDPRAEFWMGSRYLGGNVFKNDDAKAVMWIRRSAEHGHALAQLNLGIMYRDGRRGLPKDVAEAEKWFRLAAAQGDSSARAALTEIENNSVP